MNETPRLCLIVETTVSGGGLSESPYDWARFHAEKVTKALRELEASGHAPDDLELVSIPDRYGDDWLFFARTLIRRKDGKPI